MTSKQPILNSETTYHLFFKIFKFQFQKAGYVLAFLVQNKDNQNFLVYFKTRTKQIRKSANSEMVVGMS